MQVLKNSIIGFLISFMGSLPMGYLTIVGFELYNKSGMAALVPYLFGVISIEVFVIYFTLIFADKLSRNKKLIKGIDFFYVLFLLALAYIFYMHSKSPTEEGSYWNEYASYSPFMIGVVLSAINFVQVPFWAAWNLYLLSNKFISAAMKFRFWYVGGTLAGSFFGIMTISLLLNYISNASGFFSKYLMSHVIPLLFVTLAIFQAYRFYHKYFAKKSN